jgi:hypothetical protein
MTLQDILERLLLERPIPVERITTEMANASRLANPDDIHAVLRVANLHDVFDQTIAYPAMSLLPAGRRIGIQRLCEMASHGPHSSCAFSILAAVALGRIPSSADVHFLREHWDVLEKYRLDPDLIPLAARSVREVVLGHLTDPHMKSRLLNAISFQSLFPSDNTFQAERLDFLMDMLVDTHMVLNREILENFEALLEKPPDREEDLQRFLVEHPVLLDPFVSELRTKHELGDDFITDFVVRRTNDEYVVVEIENSTDKLFKRDGSFSHDLMLAIGQVRDFQAWISDNIAYAQTKLPGIRRPDGLVVIGRRVGLDAQMEKRLSEENFSRRGHIRIVTYDDLVSQAKSVYKNAIERPVVLRSRDQKSI